MNLLRAIVEALNPCFHQWDVVDTLKDNPENPRTVHVIRVCSICGKLDQQKVDAPAPSGCPPHKWQTVESIKLVSDIKNPINTLGYRLIQQCQTCGDTRTKEEGVRQRT